MGIVLESLTLVILVVGLLGVLSLWFYYDKKDKALYDNVRRYSVFHCIRCDKVYKGRFGEEASFCKTCGHKNIRMKF